MGITHSRSASAHEATTDPDDCVLRPLSPRGHTIINMDIKEVYSMNQELGRGRFSVVKKGTHKKTGKHVAVKSVDQNLFGREQAALLKELEDEIEVMRRIQHPNCLQLYEVYKTKSKLYMVMELADGGELFDRVVKKKHYSEREACSCFVQIMSAIEYLHGIGIAHRDIKPESILYASAREDSGIKLSDFGLGKYLDPDVSGHANAMATFCGTPGYLAPEVIERKGYGMECDVWGAGVVLYILLCGFPPFDGTRPLPVLFDLIKKASYSFPETHWGEISGEAKAAVKGMLVADRRARMTPAQCLKTPWVQAFLAGSSPDRQMKVAQRRLRDWNSARKIKGALHAYAAMSRLDRSPDRPGPAGHAARTHVGGGGGAGGGGGGGGGAGKGRFTAEEVAVLERIRGDQERETAMRDSFDMLDRSKTGRISVKDLWESLRAVGRGREEGEVRVMVARFDVDGSGDLDFDEFCLVCAGDGHALGEGQGGERELRAAFECLDVDRSGRITPSEILRALRRLGVPVSDEEVTEMFRLADSDGDGSIDFLEMQALLNRRLAGPDASPPPPAQSPADAATSAEACAAAAAAAAAAIAAVASPTQGAKSGAEI